jgi:nifR3 family TIM-barrel protein
VSAKIRAGWDANKLNFCEMGQALEEAGVAAVALHPRTRAQGYAGRADWTRIAKLKEAVKTVPVIGNGDVTTPEHAFRMLAETNCDAVMIGRGALGNPWIFRQLLGGAPPTAEERCALVLRHFDAHRVYLGADLPAVREFRRHWGWYSHGLPGSSAFRNEVNRLEDAEAAKALATRFFSEAGGSSEHASVDDAEVDYRAAYG